MSVSFEFIYLLQDSVERTGSGNSLKDSLTKTFDNEQIVIADTSLEINQEKNSLIEAQGEVRIIKTPVLTRVTHEPEDTTNIDTNSIQTLKDVKKFNRYHLFKEQEKTFAYKPLGVFSSEKDSVLSYTGHIHFEQRQFQQSKFSWALIIGFISIFLLLILKTYYQKFLTQVIYTLVNFQLSEKMLREKNIIVRRTFFILNLNYLIVFSLFVVLLLKLFDFHIHDNYFVSYLYVTLAIILILFARLILLYFTGIIFNSLPVVSEYVHNIYLINKNLGIILLPLVFATLYTSIHISKILVITCLIIVCIGTFFKYIRGLQIIIKNDVLKFYSFLYLCTVELLPIVISSKIIITLR